MGDPFENVGPTAANPTDIYICFCNTPLGPCDPTSFAHTISLRFGKKQDIEQGILKKYLGEIPPNGAFSYPITQCTELFFVVLDPHNPLAAYHATRTALLYVIERCGGFSERKLAASDDQQFRQKSRNTLLVPEVFQAAGTRKSCPLQGSSTGLNIKHVTFFVSGKTKTLTQEDIVWQMACAYRRMARCRPNLTDDCVSLTERSYRKYRNTPRSSEEQQLRVFSELVKRGEVVRRGIMSTQEVNWLLHWLTDSTSLPMQLAAAVALVDYIRSEKPTLPIDLSRRQVLDSLFTQEKCLSTILNLAGQGQVSLHSVIKPEEITKGDQVGKGGTALVYTAKYAGQTVAYKEFIEGAVTMSEFRTEVALMSLLKHPCLVNIIGAGAGTDGPFLVMEYVAKGDLYHILHESDSKDPISDDKICAWAMDIACGMQYLHSLGIIHRDLKSLNILVTHDDRCKIIDYGASRVNVDTNMTGNIGTISWMAPEMFAGTGSYTEKVDVYSFAIVLYELVVREIPFVGENSFSLPVQVAKGVRPKIPKGVSKKWTKLLAQCWHDKPSKRPSFGKILDILQPMLHTDAK